MMNKSKQFTESVRDSKVIRKEADDAIRRITEHTRNVKNEQKQ